MINFPFSTKELFDIIGNREQGAAAINENLGLIAKVGDGVSRVLDAEIFSQAQGEIRIGNVLITIGRTFTAATTFEVLFPNSYDDDNVYVFIQEASDAVAHQAQLDGNNLPDRNGFDVIANSVTGAAHYFWIAIGTKIET